MAVSSNALARHRSLVIWAVRFAVSATVLVLIFRAIPLSGVASAAALIPPALWLAALGLFLAGHAVAAAKWHILIGGGVDYRSAFRAHLAGLAANLALPGVAGGDVVRAGLVMRTAHDKSRVVVGSISDRLLDTIGLAIIALTGAYFAWRPEWDGGSVRWLLIAAVAALIATLAAAPLINRFMSARQFSNPVARLIAKLAGVAADLSRQPTRLLLCLAMSMVVQCLFVAINIAFAQAAHIEAPVAAWFYGWATAKIIAIAPISLGGLGVREASMAGLLKPFGADSAGVVAIALIWQSVLFASGLIGFLVQLSTSSRSKLSVGAAS